MQEYNAFLASKGKLMESAGFDCGGLEQYSLFPFQEAIVKWACRKGRRAIFADTGLGKTRMQLAWADQLRKSGVDRVLILAPLCVAQQTISEGERIGVNVEYLKSVMPDSAGGPGIFITNYDRVDAFFESINDGWVQGIILDESSILKHESSKTRAKLIECTTKVPYRLSCTATPSPNDYMELGYQCEFLGVMSNAEMLAMYFIHDGGQTSQWRLKGHAKQVFFEFLSTWAVYIKLPSDIGFTNEGYLLPELKVENVVVGEKYFIEVKNELKDRLNARRAGIPQRVEEIRKRIIEIPNESIIIWCHLNEESRQLHQAIPDSIEVSGSDSIESKERKLLEFTNGQGKILITKPSIAGFGLNWQHCHHVFFASLTDSYEEYYQAVRRCYRFGQSSIVNVTAFLTAKEVPTMNNIIHKEKIHNELMSTLANILKDFTKREMGIVAHEKKEYVVDKKSGEGWELWNGDSAELLTELPDGSIDYSVFSPPFSSLYVYSDSERDLGNSKNDAEFFEHFDYIIKELLRVLRQGRCLSVHCTQLTASITRNGYIGLRDFRGEIIKHFVDAGFIYHSEVCIWKDPVVAMQRTKALGLLWKQIKKDSSMCRQGLPDYLVTFRKPGVNDKPLNHDPDDFTVDEWQNIASPIWMGINQSNTLQSSLASENEDEKHICPLQLEVIQNCIRLWSGEGDRVLSPFAGIGSEGYVARQMNRQFIGIELKKSYFDIAVKNLLLSKPDKKFNKSKLKNVRELQRMMMPFMNTEQKQLSESFGVKA